MPPTAGSRNYFLTPVANGKDVTARDTIKRLLEAGVYAFGDNTPYRMDVKPGDSIRFYENSVGLVAEATVTSAPEQADADTEELDCRHAGPAVGAYDMADIVAAPRRTPIAANILIAST